MKIKYLGLGSNLKEILFDRFDKNEEVTYIFENSPSFYEIKREYFNNTTKIFNKFKLLTLNDFYEKILKTDKIVIKEEKQVVLFYNALTTDLRKKLRINSYYDVIDLAYNYYNLFAELQEYKVKMENIEIEEWQKEVFENLLEIDENINEKVREKGLILPYMLRKIENISHIFMKNNKKFCFINKVKFTPFEKELIEVLEKEGIEIENIVQLKREHFDEEKLTIKNNFTIPIKEEFLKKNINIEIYEYDNKFAQLLGMLKKMENEKLEWKIYDTQDINNKTKTDYQLLDQNKIVYNLEETMENTEIYKVLTILLDILENVKVKKYKHNENDENNINKANKVNKENNENRTLFDIKLDTNESLNESIETEYLFKVKDLFKAFKSKEFINIFGIKKIYPLFQNLAASGYKYISRKMLNEELTETFIHFLEQIEKIYEVTSLIEYAEILEEIFDKQGKIEKNIRDKYFEALSEIVVLEDFDFDNLWQGFFNENISAGLLKLFLKYLDKKAISLDLEEIDEQETDSKYKINAFSAISQTNKKNIIFLNLQDTFPKVRINNYLFSQIQRKNMGLPVNEELKQIEIFKFLNNVFGAENVCLSYIKNLDENTDCAGIVEEIKLKYGINKNSDIKVTESEELEFVKKYFTKKGEEFKEKAIGPFIQSELKKDREKLLEQRFGLGYYTFEKIRDFEYGYYLEEMIGDTEIEKIEDIIEPMLFGNIVHPIYEKLVKDNKERIEKKDFNFKDEEIREEFYKLLSVLEYKIPTEFIEFYKNVSFEEILKGVRNFFKYLKRELEDSEKIEIYSEEKVREKIEKKIENIRYKNVYFNGIMDLHIKASQHEYLIDYKSGKLDSNKLEKALNQLDFYSIILGNENIEDRKKMIVDIWSGEIKKDNRDESKNKGKILTREDVDAVIKKYFDEKSYGLGEKGNSFNHKKYALIARREEENRENWK